METALWGWSIMPKQVKAGVRDAGLVREQYEDHWGFVLAQARAAVAAEPHNLARAHALCSAAFAHRPVKRRWLRGRRIAALLAGRPLPPSLSRRAIDAISRAAVADLLLGYCRPETARIIELGSGWGANLFNLWFAGGPRTAEYVALEYTAAGRETAALLAATDAALALRTAPFDYFKPELSAYVSTDSTLVFTCHSIEQITALGDAIFDALLALPGLDCVVHIEPVGWQLDSGTPWEPVMTALSWITPPTLSLAVEERRRTRAKRYNTDLVPRLRALERTGRIAIERIERNFVAPNPFNPGTVIVWRPVR